MKILALILDGYQDIELSSVIGALNSSGELEKITYYNPDKKTDIFGSNKIGSIKTVFTYNVNDYDAIFISGGKLAIELRTNKKALSVVKEFIDNNKYIISLCDSPNALCEAKLLCDKKYASYPIENIESSSCEKRDKSAITMIDGKYITGRGPASGLELGLLVIKTLVSKEVSDKVRATLFA